MIEHFNRAASPTMAGKSGIHFRLRAFSMLAMLALLVASAAARVEEAEDQYLRIFGLIERADAMSQRGENDSARTNYIRAQIQLLSLKKSNPNWNSKLVTYRLEYLTERIAAMSRETNSTAPVSTAAQAGSKAAASVPDQVKLLEAGAEPRKLLRINPKPGDKQILAVTLKFSMEMDMAGAPVQAVKIPAIHLTLDTTVKAVSATGEITYELVVTDAGMVDETGAAPQLAEAMKPSLNNLKGFSSTGVTSSRGFNKGINIKLGTNADPQARQLMAQLKEMFANLLPPLPEEPVGQGAKWEARLKLKSQGMTIDQTSTFQLNSIEGERLSLSGTVVQNAANQKLQNSAMPGLNGIVNKLTGGGSGDAQMDLSQLMPVKAGMNNRAEISLAVTMGTQKQAMIMKTETEMTLEAK